MRMTSDSHQGQEAHRASVGSREEWGDGSESSGGRAAKMERVQSHVAVEAANKVGVWFCLRGQSALELGCTETLLEAVWI